jgi:steroid delta-isomerase-like uncharacterized protein
VLTEPEILEALFQAYDAHDLSRVASLYAADATHVDIAAGRPKEGREHIVDGLASFLSGFPDASWTPTGTATEDGRAFGQYVVTGSLQQDLWSFSGLGQRLELCGVLVLHCTDGLVQRSEDYWDAGTFRRQMTHNHQGDQA